METKSGLHIHHMVPGILLLMVSGYLGLSLEPASPWRELLAVAFGVGLGLTLDEFALWLNLEDVYWQQQGRESVDAVIVAASLLAVTFIGLPFWVDVFEAVLTTAGMKERAVGDTSTAILVTVQVVAVLLAAGRHLQGQAAAGAGRRVRAAGRPDRRRAPGQAPLALGAPLLRRRQEAQGGGAVRRRADRAARGSRPRGHVDPSTLSACRAQCSQQRRRPANVRRRRQAPRHPPPPERADDSRLRRIDWWRIAPTLLTTAFWRSST